MNPQITYGEDIVSRITQVMESTEKRVQLQKMVTEAINRLLIDLCAEACAESENVIDAVVVGNTAMHHLWLQLSVNQLAFSPFVPSTKGALDVKARDIGLIIAPGAYVHLLPNIAGFVGADHVAMLLATQDLWAAGTVLALDIGTNTEVSLISEGEIHCASCASGPAFEGAHIRDGMRAASGAIERLRLVGDEVEYQTIGGGRPIGICGSGILDAIAQFRLAGILDRGGRIGDHSRVRSRNGQREVVLVSKNQPEGAKEIVVTQQDVREIQLAKGAIRTGIELLLTKTGKTGKDIEKVIIAGAFGSYIDVASAVAIGMFPPLPLDHFQQVGNAAGTGARLALISNSKRAEAQAIAKRVHYIELAADPLWQEVFARATYLE